MVLIVPVLLFAMLAVLIRVPLVLNKTMSLAITADLLITIPFIHFLLIRKTAIPKTTIIPVMVVGLLIGTWLLPENSKSYLNLFKTWLLPVIETVVFVFVIIKVRGTLQKYKSIKDTSPDFYTALRHTCSSILPKRLVMPFVTEIAVLFYGFIKWRSPELKANQFSYHKNTGTLALFGAFIFIILIETVALHLLLIYRHIF